MGQALATVPAGRLVFTRRQEVHTCRYEIGVGFVWADEPSWQDDRVFVLIAHFADADSGEDREAFRADTDVALTRMAADPGCRRLRWARSTDDSARWVLVAEFDTAADYRRMLSPFPAREALVPWLSRADQATSGVSEVWAAADGAQMTIFEPTVPG